MEQFIEEQNSDSLPPPCHGYTRVTPLECTVDSDRRFHGLSVVAALHTQSMVEG